MGTLANRLDKLDHKFGLIEREAVFLSLLCVQRYRQIHDETVYEMIYIYVFMIYDIYIIEIYVIFDIRSMNFIIVFRSQALLR